MKWCVVCVFLTCVIAWTCGVLNAPCNVLQIDCDVGECCSTAGTGVFEGVCKADLKVGDECTPGVPALGQCSCSRGMSCVSLEADGGVSKCFYLPH